MGINPDGGHNTVDMPKPKRNSSGTEETTNILVIGMSKVSWLRIELKSLS